MYIIYYYYYCSYIFILFKVILKIGIVLQYIWVILFKNTLLISIFTNQDNCFNIKFLFINEMESFHWMYYYYQFMLIKMYFNVNLNILFNFIFMDALKKK